MHELTQAQIQAAFDDGRACAKEGKLFSEKPFQYLKEKARPLFYQWELGWVEGRREMIKQK